VAGRCHVALAARLSIPRSVLARTSQLRETSRETPRHAAARGRFTAVASYMILIRSYDFHHDIGPEPCSANLLCQPALPSRSTSYPSFYPAPYPAPSSKPSDIRTARPRPRDTGLRVEAHTSPHRRRLDPGPLRAPTMSAHREGKKRQGAPRAGNGHASDGR
jgi:hypothetical protein